VLAQNEVPHCIALLEALVVASASVVL